MNVVGMIALFPSVLRVSITVSTVRVLFCSQGVHRLFRVGQEFIFLDAQALAFES